MGSIILAAVWTIRSQTGVSGKLFQAVRDAAKSARSYFDATETGTISNFFGFQTACIAIELAEMMTVESRHSITPFAETASKLELIDIELKEVPGSEFALRSAINDVSSEKNELDIFTIELGRGAADPARYNLKTMKASADRDPKWVFWIKWYEGFVEGKPLDWDLQERIALDPNPNEIISELLIQLLSDELPLAERITYDPIAAVFRQEPIALENPRLVAATLSRLEDAWDDVVARPSNGLSEASREARLVRRTIVKYAHDPQQIELNLTDLHQSLVRQIAVTEELPSSEENLALQRAAGE